MRPVGVDSESNGFLSVVECGFSGSAIKIWVRQFNVTFEGLLILKLVFTSKFGQFDNLGAVRVWANPKGLFSLPIIQDDTLKPEQRIQFSDVKIPKIGGMPPLLLSVFLKRQRAVVLRKKKLVRELKNCFDKFSHCAILIIVETFERRWSSG